MSLGSTYNNNQNNNQRPENNVQVFSPYRMNHGESEIDATCITFRFWKTNLIIGIFPRKNTGNDEMTFDMDNGISIYLSHTKARILKHELELFLKDPVTYSSVGVPSGQSIIYISNGTEYGKETPVLTITKVDESGKPVSSFAYEFHRNFHFSIRNYSVDSFDRVYDEYNTLEIEQLITLLDEYVKASTNAIAFTVMDQRKYSVARTDAKIDAIAASLGVELPKAGGRRGSFNNSSFFNNGGASSSGSGGYSSGVSYGSATIDDIE